MKTLSLTGKALVLVLALGLFAACGNGSPSIPLTASGKVTTNLNKNFVGATVYVPGTTQASLKLMSKSFTMDCGSNGGTIVCANAPAGSCGETCACADGTFTLSLENCATTPTQILACQGSDCETFELDCDGDSCEANLDTGFGGAACAESTECGAPQVCTDGQCLCPAEAILCDQDSDCEPFFNRAICQNNCCLGI